MTEIIRPDLSHLWANGGAIVTPSTTKIDTGWTAEVPPYQWENFIQNRQDQALVHLFQKGISVWSATQDYYFTASGTRAYVQGSNGTIYVAVANSTGQDPTADTNNVYWAKGFVSVSDVLNLIPHTLTTLTGSGNFTVPSGITRLEVDVWSGGGGGGGIGATGGVGGGGGAGGSYSKKILAVTPGQIIAYVVGAAGGAGGSGAAGGVGGTSSFGSVVSVVGGAGGAAGGAGTGNGGSSSTGTGGDINFVGGSGGQGTSALGGQGANAAVGGSGSQGGAGASSPGGFPGGGGAGRGPASVGSGGAGGAGTIIIRY